MLKPLLALLPLLASSARALEWTPVLAGSLAGGQYFFEGQKANLSGNASLTAAGLVKTKGSWSYLPMYSGAYRGTKGIDDGVGSGTLFQQQMDHAFSFTGIRKLEGTWRVKPSAGYKRQFLKETRDESWGKGLFDYEKISAGLELENVYKEPFAFRAGLDVFRVRFPNYESLESRSGADPFGDPLGRELAPKRVLDTNNLQVSASGSRPFPARDPKYVVNGAWSFLYKSFADQRLVRSDGQFENSGRRDLAHTLGGTITRPMPARWAGPDGRLDLSFGLNASYVGSNQNTFDATFARFIADSYSYWTLGAGPGATVSWGDRKAPAWATASLRWSRQTYLGRLVQNGDGVYGSAKQRHDRWTLGLGYGYPIAPKLTMTFRTNVLWASSNHKNEKNYSYTFRAMNYLIGLAYEY
ncbi:MAG: hypothetical protein M0D55_04835 [Elusimicrobiota bacterium]|nr:MAG: hypothetical protein M0D55_04835 [Elusimicrobiota bacterium]